MAEEKTADEKRFGVNFDRPLVSSKDEGRLCQFGEMMMSGVSLGCVLRVVEDGQAICSWDLQNMLGIEIDVQRCKHHEPQLQKNLSLPGRKRNIRNYQIALNLRRSQKETRAMRKEQMNMANNGRSSTGVMTTLGITEAQAENFRCVPDVEHARRHLRCVDVMRRRRTSIDRSHSSTL